MRSETHTSCAKDARRLASLVGRRLGPLAGEGELEREPEPPGFIQGRLSYLMTTKDIIIQIFCIVHDEVKDPRPKGRGL